MSLVVLGRAGGDCGDAGRGGDGLSRASDRRRDGWTLSLIVSATLRGTGQAYDFDGGRRDY